MSTTRAVETVFRIESARIIAGVTRIVRDVGIAEEIAQDALVAALEQWPVEGVPERPGAWLTTTARNRAIDLVRRKEAYARKLAEVGRALEDVPPPEEPAEPEDIDDDLLRLIFTACHPVLRTEGRVALTLRLMGGLTTQEIARAFLTSESTVAQRIVRAKPIVALYGRLVVLIPSPVVELNRAVAVSMAEGPEAALPLVEALAAEPALASYHLLPSVRGDLLERLGRGEEARVEFERAASLTRNARERSLLLRRARAAAGR
ncbi:RNA polymerase sigma factor [Streptomyces sp. NPDC059999]|uniref:RNA polymerase sigma factor n=1 Tax=Streptomyces sp. NPDC059999 TaxID=3347030 RepID=UPI00369CEEB0